MVPYFRDAVDCLPESSTCANMLYLPNYTSAKIAEEKIRYATYNCMDIDTDMNLWEDWDQLNHHSNIGDSSTISLTICDIHLNIFDGKWRCCRTQIKTEGEIGGNVGNWKMWETGTLVKMGGNWKMRKMGESRIFWKFCGHIRLASVSDKLMWFYR